MRTRKKKPKKTHPKGVPEWKRKWRQTQAKAVAEVHAGEKQNAVAKRYGVTKQAINQWVKAAAAKGHGLRHLTELQRRKVRRKAVALVKAGISRAATAQRFGVSELSVGKWVKLYNSGGLVALDVVRLDEEEEQDPKKHYHKDTGREKVEYFLLRYDVEERPIRVGRAEGKMIAENFVNKTVACHQRDHEVIGAYFDTKRGIVLSYVHVPINKDALE